MKVKNIMSQNLICVSKDETARRVSVVMSESKTGFVPVCENGLLIGVITDRDLVLRCLAEGANPDIMTAEELMTKNPVAISPGHSVTEAARLMAREGIRRLVVCENGVAESVLSLGDISRSRSFFAETAAAFCDISQAREEPLTNDKK